ncbi:MinD/ParA family ATP-binding protein [Micromonospora auratinigra]|uniref:MinD/ParA family ATP-binding protein n=1 Tax=Micromonospora auratinigra TaxID=261654 RepID=UPI000B820A9A|nr:AAA family ATPase [Micromonospora auratinigra]
MDGSETSWGRQAEPAPRWRALLDRARLSGRGADHTEAERRADERPPPPAEPLPRRPAGSGWTGRVQPVEPAYGAEPAYRVEATYRVEPAYRVEPGYGDPGYGADPGYAVEPGYQAAPAYRVDPEPRAEPSWRAEPTYRPEPPEPEPRGRGTASVDSRYALLDNGYRPEPPPPESRYALLERGRYRPDVRPAPEEPALPAPAVPAYQPAVESYPARVEPARVEWRAPAPETELDRAAAVLRRELGGPRVLAFANPKGGVHKTTATVLAAATVGSVRGRGVLAWDDNELRGTLGLRAGSARHARTIRHLIHDLAQIEIMEGATLLEHLDDYLRHASDGSYDVLAGEESPRFAQRLDQFTVKRVLELLRRTHDVVCVDTGNNVESSNWRTVMQAADQLVVTTVPREDAAFSADWMLDLLHEVGMGELADNAVTLISCPTPGRSPLQDDLERHFATRTRAVAVVPYDPALETGSSIEYHQLQAETRQAWLKAASVMLEPFVR